MDLETICIILITHSRIFHPKLKFSGVWQAIAKGFKESLKKIGVKFDVLSLKENYNDVNEYIEKVAEGVTKKPDALILPFTPKQGELRRKFFSLLKDFKGIIIGINVPISPLEIEELKGKLRGYVGMNEFEAGRVAAKQLLMSDMDFDTIYVPVDKPDHYGYLLRIEGIENIAKPYGKFVQIIDINNKEESISICKSMERPAIISLGPIGTEFALNVQGKNPAIVAMDLDSRTEEAILSGKITCTLIQHPEEQGALAAQLAVDILTGEKTSPYTEIFCGPTIVDRNNIAIFK